MRIIWIDDIRDPHMELYYKGSGIIRYKSVLPKEFLSLISNEEPEIIWCKNYNEFITYIYHNTERFDRVSTCICFDHDLGPGKDGLDCAKYLINYIIETHDILPFYECHSNNLAGKENIISYLESYKKSIS